MTTKQEEGSKDGSERLEGFEEVGHRQKYAGGSRSWRHKEELFPRVFGEHGPAASMTSAP